MARISITLFMSTVFFTFPTALSAQELENASQVEERDVYCEIKQTNEGVARFHCVVEGKPIRVGAKIRMNLTLHNSGSLPLVFDRFKLGCNCLQLACRETEILPSKEIKAVADYQMPKSKTNQYVIQMAMAQGNDEVCQFSMSGFMEGVLEILGPSLYESNGTVSLWNVPLFITAPVETSRLSVELSHELRDLVAEIVVVDGKPFVKIECPESSLGVTGIAGQISVSDPELNVRTSARIGFVSKPLVRVSPLVSQFNKADEKSGRLEAFVLIQAFQTKDDPENIIISEPNRIVDIKCLADERFDIKLEKQKINDCLFRVKVSIASIEIEDKEFELKWSVNTLRDSVKLNGTGFLTLEK